MTRKDLYRRWNKLELIKLGGIEAHGDNPSNWKEFEKQYKPMEDWCKENCNKKHYKIFIIDDGWHDSAIYIGKRFYFKYKADAMGFKLRWT